MLDSLRGRPGDKVRVVGIWLLVLMAESALVALRYRMLTLEAAGARNEKEVEALRERLGDKMRPAEWLSPCV